MRRFSAVAFLVAAAQASPGTMYGEDMSTMLQSTAQTQEHTLGDVWKLAKGFVKGVMPKKINVNCTARPMLCGSPVHCDSKPPSIMEQLRWSRQITRRDGHVNLGAWCRTSEMYASTIVQECLISKDMKTFAHRLYDKQEKAGSKIADRSYCKLEGHCENTDVTWNTTVEEAEKLCDKKYGHKKWVRTGYRELQTWDWEIKGKITPKEGIKDPKISEFYGRLACAMGNFHCDVIYCKETHCKDM